MTAHKLVPVEPTDEMLIAAMKAAGAFAEPFESSYECGVITEQGMTQEDCDMINAECMECYRREYKAMISAAPVDDGVLVEQALERVRQELYKPARILFTEKLVLVETGLTAETVGDPLKCGVVALTLDDECAKMVRAAALSRSTVLEEAAVATVARGSDDQLVFTPLRDFRVTNGMKLYLMEEK